MNKGMFHLSNILLHPFKEILYIDVSIACFAFVPIKTTPFSETPRFSINLSSNALPFFPVSLKTQHLPARYQLLLYCSIKTQ